MDTLEDETLIGRLRERSKDPKKSTDEGRAAHRIIVAATAQQVGDAESSLGFRLPDLLQRLYLTVGNGGFGPGHGLLGVPISASDKTAMDTLSSSSGHYFRLRSNAKTSWPEGLLPLCEWGGGIASCIDCTQLAAPIIRLDPNMPRSDVALRVPAAMHYVRAEQVGEACWIESISLSQWLSDWLDGRSLFYAAYGGNSSEDDFDEEDEEEGELE